ncbi:MAG: metal ABC transporter substrate-binding protein [Dehalococcoidia bacterium]|jgi:zinc transport system substrate-binding protein|nr:metal ABC transporter substrate-binding protein [Dehalococcoidia bacterium]
MNKARAIFLLLLAPLAVVAVAACDGETEEPANGEMAVVTTTYPLSFLARRIGGDRVSVTQLVKPGVEAHDFEPAPSDIRAISNADVFFYNHPAFEGWALSAARASGSEPGSTVQTVILETEGEDHGGQAVSDADFDAHVWLNPLDLREQVELVVAALSTANPDGSLNYEQNGAVLKAELQELDAVIAGRVADCALDTVVVSHLAYGHMAERYGFNQVGLTGLSPEFDSGPAHIAGVIERISALGIRHILREPIVSSRLAETVAAETGAEVLVLHPLEVRTPAEVEAGDDYIGIMEANAGALATALQCG